MRCCALLRGICVLGDAGLGALAGILYRQHWETWLLSLHLVLRGEETLAEICGDNVVHTRKLITGLDLGSEYDPDWDENPNKLTIYQLAQKLGPLLNEAGEDGDADVGVTEYNAVYRPQSQYAVHAGLSTIALYLKCQGEESWSVEPTPSAPFGEVSQFSALRTLRLAKYVFESFGISTEAVEAAMNELYQFVKSEGESSRN